MHYENDNQTFYKSCLLFFHFAWNIDACIIHIFICSRMQLIYMPFSSGDKNEASSVDVVSNAKVYICKYVPKKLLLCFLEYWIHMYESISTLPTTPNFTLLSLSFNIYIYIYNLRMLMKKHVHRWWSMLMQQRSCKCEEKVEKSLVRKRQRWRWRSKQRKRQVLRKKMISLPTLLITGNQGTILPRTTDQIYHNYIFIHRETQQNAPY